MNITLAEVTPTQPTSAEPRAHIAVLVSLNFPDMTEPVADLVRRFTRVALETLVELGASYDVLDTSQPLPDPAVAASYDGLLLLGGGDIDPATYGLDLAEVPNSYGMDVRADQDALAAISAVEQADQPIFAICRGAQLVNVARGGTLLPDLVDFALHHGGEGEPLFLDEQIDLHPGTRLQALIGLDRVVGRSGHHQAVDRLGRGLVVSAAAQDGIVEGFEDPDRWVVGVQWHPEDDDGPGSDRRRLFAGFVEACLHARRA